MSGRERSNGCPCAGGDLRCRSRGGNGGEAPRKPNRAVRDPASPPLSRDPKGRTPGLEEIFAHPRSLQLGVGAPQVSVDGKWIHRT